jgi:hypothetical protein
MATEQQVDQWRARSTAYELLRRQYDELAADNGRLLGDVERLKKQLTIAEGVEDNLVNANERLLAERGTYILALEQIRSAPLAKESSIQRYKRCREIASQALDKHADERIVTHH